MTLEKGSLNILAYSPEKENLEILKYSRTDVLNSWSNYLPPGGGGVVSKLYPTPAIPWTVACQAPLSVGFSSKNIGMGCRFLLQGIFLTQELNLSPALQADSLPTEL